MSTPNDPQNPYGAEQPGDPYGEQPSTSGPGATPPYPAAPQYGQPAAPQYGEPQYPAAPQYGQPAAPQYGQPQYPAAPQYGAYAAPAPANYLVWAILSTVFCCLPLGIAAIVFASQVNSKWMAGDIAGAENSSRKAKLFTIWSAAVGGAGILIWGILAIIGVASGNGSSTY